MGEGAGLPLDRREEWLQVRLLTRILRYLKVTLGKLPQGYLTLGDPLELRKDILRNPKEYLKEKIPKVLRYIRISLGD
jgi:hypothetical protein